MAPATRIRIRVRKNKHENDDYILYDTITQFSVLYSSRLTSRLVLAGPVRLDVVFLVLLWDIGWCLALLLRRRNVGEHLHEFRRSLLHSCCCRLVLLQHAFPGFQQALHEQRALRSLVVRRHCRSRLARFGLLLEALQRAAHDEQPNNRRDCAHKDDKAEEDSVALRRRKIGQAHCGEDGVDAAELLRELRDGDAQLFKVVAVAVRVAHT